MKKLSKLARDSQFIGSIIWHGVSILLNCSKLLPDRQFADFLYWLKRKGKLNLTNPNTFNEKLWWLKFHYRNPLQKICSDKYRAREYLKEIGEESLCVPLINYYTSMDQIKLEDFQE